MNFPRVSGAILRSQLVPYIRENFDTTTIRAEEITELGDYLAEPDVLENDGNYSLDELIDQPQTHFDPSENLRTAMEHW